MSTQEEDVSEIIYHYKQLRQVESLHHQLKKISPYPLFSTLTIDDLQDFLLVRKNNHFKQVVSSDIQDDIPRGIQSFPTRVPSKK